MIEMIKYYCPYTYCPNTKTEIINVYVDKENYEKEIIISLKIKVKDTKEKMKLNDPKFSVFGFENIYGNFMKKEEYPSPGYLDPENGDLRIDKVGQEIGYTLIRFKVDKDYLKRIEKLRVGYVHITLKFKLSYFGYHESENITTPINLTMIREMQSNIECFLKCDYRINETKWKEIIYLLGYYDILLKKINPFELAKNIYTISKFLIGIGLTPLPELIETIKQK